jgi:hypothetical protein
MAILGIKCEKNALGNVAADFVGSPPARPKALQRGGDHPTFTNSDSTKRQTI